MSDKAILKAFNGHLDLTSAYSWKKDKILQFLDEICDNAQTYIANEGVENVREVVGLIKRIITNQGDVLDRIVIRDTESKVLAHKFAIANIVVAFHTIFDLLGWIFYMSTTPKNADPESYYIPFGSVYARWCAQLSPDPSKPPIMTQIFWYTTQQQNTHSLCTYFDLNAVSAGVTIFPPPKVFADQVQTDSRFQPTSSKPTSEEKTKLIEDKKTEKTRINSERVKAIEEIRAQRCAQMEIYGIDLEAAERVFGKEGSAMTSFKKDGFGRCAECLMFTIIKQAMLSVDIKEIHGIALRADAMISIEPYNLKNIMEEAEAAPCKFCQAIFETIDPSKQIINNFLWNKFREDREWNSKSD